MRRAYWIYCCFLVVAATTTVNAATFFVDTVGDDSNPGTSAALPFRTIQQAIDVAAETPGPDMIKIAAGVYEENLEIDDPDKLMLAGKGECVVVAADESEHVIKIDGGDVTISNLEVTGGDDGIKAKKLTSLTLRDVVVTGNADEGLDAKKVRSVTIVHGTFSENGDDGIKVEVAEAVQITGTTILDNGGDGVDLEKISAIRVTDLTVDGNGDEGLEVDDSGSAVVVRGTYSNNADEGLDIDNTLSIRIVSIVSTGNGGNGLQVEADDEEIEIEAVSIVGSVFSDNDEDGIQIVEDGTVVHRVTLTNITARNNVESGLDIDVSGSVRLSRVISEDNGEPDVLP